MSYDGIDLGQLDGDQKEHLRHHITDGRWHDDCPWCRERRVHGGTGVTVSAVGVQRQGPTRGERTASGYSDRMYQRSQREVI